MADTKFGYLVVETVDGTRSFLVSKLVVPNGSVQLSEAESAELSGGGDVIGPALAVNDRVAVFDGTTGKLIKDGGSTIADIVAGVGAAPLGATYITQTPNATLTNEQALSTLATGLLKNTTTTGVLSIAVPDTDYLTPTGNGSGLTNLSGANLTDNSVSLAKLADIATASFLGRNTAGTGDPEVLNITTAKTMLGLSGTNTGDVTLAGENYLSITAQVITANQINLAGSNVTGILTSNKGGTGSAFFAVAGPTVTRTYTFPDANSTIARTDAGQTFTGTNNFEHMLPALTDTYDLGSSIKLWRKGWLSELDAVLFAQNTASLIGGWLIIGKNEGAIPVGQDVGSADTTIDFGQAMTLNDFVVFRAALQVEYVQVGSLVSGTRYNVTRNVDGSGANAWVAGTVYLVLGNTGNGRIELNSNATPRISLITQGSAYNTQTELLRIGDLNGSWGVAVETFGFAVGQYGVAGKSSLRIDDSGIRFFNNITERIRLLADGSGYLANTAIAWDTSGNLTVTANAAIGGWTVGATAISNGTTYIASGFDPPSGPISWFGKAGAAAFQGWNLRDSSNRHIGAFVGSTSAYPYMSIYDGTHYRVILGSLNQAFEADGATNSIGMKIFNTSGAKLVEFSDVQNIIAGWTIATTKISSTGIDIHSGANAGLAFGTTPPTSASNGTGIWLDRTGLTGLLTNVVQTQMNASGKFLAGAGNVTLDANGISIAGFSVSTSKIKWTDTLIGEASIHGSDEGAGEIGVQLISKSVSTGAGGRVALSTANSDSSWQTILNVISSPADAASGGASLLVQDNRTAATSDLLKLNHRSTGTPAAGFGSAIRFLLESSTTNDRDAAQISSVWTTATDASRSAAIVFQTVTSAAALTEVARIGQGLQMGAPTGGDKGAGTINVSADIYKNNSAYGNPDFVFEHWATGKIEKFSDKEGASDYKGLRPLSEVREFVRSNYHLPGFGQKAGHGLFSGGDQLLLTVEQMYLHIFELEQQIKELKGNQ